jgi:protein involved in polysaccharide export with SLBB domain
MGSHAEKRALGATLLVAAALVWPPTASRAADPAPVTPIVAESAPPASPTAHYRLGADDKVRIITFDEPQLTGEFVVGAGGMIALPLIGDVPAKDMTVDQIAANITAKLKDGFIKQPSVSVEVITFRPFYILGEVNKPGQYPYQNGLTVMEAVATAGGFTYRANEKTIFIREEDGGGEQKTRLTSLTEVQPGDTIRISERFF